MSTDWRLALADDAATAALGAAFAHGLTALDRAPGLALAGDLGAGKTTLARGFIRALGYTDPVPSPTYTLLEPYQLGSFLVSHLDLYRLADDSELEALGWRDLDETVRLVEWPERASSLLKSLDVVLTLSWVGTGRSAHVLANSALGDRWIAAAQLEIPS
ncbi:MAG: tRNA (adenosine(37)-N6)-threonylcarbamoyltransferase complex ATPase subunit type 1 TsaE [Pseudomonadota bacterium]